MSEFQLTMTAEEQHFLAELLEQKLKEKRVEEHRTRTLSYREGIVHQEKLLEGLLNRLRQPVG
jgi:hypothetical protein